MRVLIADIVTGQREVGDKLPREADLAVQFGVSRGVARECLRAMEERGLVAVRHGKGATVNDSEHWNLFDPDVLAAMLDSELGPAVLAQHLMVESAPFVAVGDERANPVTHLDQPAILEPPHDLADHAASDAEPLHQVCFAFQSLAGRVIAADDERGHLPDQRPVQTRHPSHSSTARLAKQDNL
jgi:DNA-binding transcriptional MocR family regulator